jgi:hypothetical protein
MTHSFNGLEASRVLGQVLFVLAAWGPLSGRAEAPSAFDAVEIRRGQDVKRHDKGSIKFEMNGKPWREVLEWLSEESGLPIITSCMPIGIFTFNGPKVGRYTLDEIIGILNRALQQQGHVLIRRTACLIILPDDEEFLAQLSPRP